MCGMELWGRVTCMLVEEGDVILKLEVEVFDETGGFVGNSGHVWRD